LILVPYDVIQHLFDMFALYVGQCPPCLPTYLLHFRQRHLNRFIQLIDLRQLVYKVNYSYRPTNPRKTRRLAAVSGRANHTHPNIT